MCLLTPWVLDESEATNVLAPPSAVIGVMISIYLQGIFISLENIEGAFNLVVRLKLAFCTTCVVQVLVLA